MVHDSLPVRSASLEGGAGGEHAPAVDDGATLTTVPAVTMESVAAVVGDNTPAAEAEAKSEAEAEAEASAQPEEPTDKRVEDAVREVIVAATDVDTLTVKQVL